MEIPPTQKGFHSTLEGYLTSFKEDLLLGHEQRRKLHPESAAKIDEFLLILERYIVVDPAVVPFQFIIDDPSGLSFIQNLNAPRADPNIKSDKYIRTKE